MPRFPRYISRHSSGWACLDMAIEKKIRYLLSQGIWLSYGAQPGERKLRFKMVRTVDCIRSVSASIVDPRRRGWFANPGSIVVNPGSLEWIHVLSLITGNFCFCIKGFFIYHGLSY